MKLIRSQLFWIGFLILSLLPSIALADPAEDFANGEKAYRKEELSAAMSFFTKAANQNHAPAQVRLGELLDSAEFNKEAADWYRKAAQQGYADGEYHLGLMYLKGEGVEKNAEKALYWYRRAAEKNHMLSVRTLAHAYQKGELGLAIDLNQAKLLNERADILEEAERRKNDAERAAAIKAAEDAIKAAEDNKQGVAK